MLDTNHNGVSFAETSSPSEENSTIQTSSARDTREIASVPPHENKVRGTHIQMILTNLFPHNNITYKKKVVVQEVHYSMYYVLVTDK